MTALLSGLAARLLPAWLGEAVRLGLMAALALGAVWAHGYSVAAGQWRDDAARAALTRRAEAAEVALAAERRRAADLAAKQTELSTFNQALAARLEEYRRALASRPGARPALTADDVARLRKLRDGAAPSAAGARRAP